MEAVAVTVWLSVFMVAVVAQLDNSWIQTVCDRVRKVDNSLVDHIKHLASTDRNDFLNDLREYVQAIRSFQSCVEQDKEMTLTLAQDILEEEGPKFYYHYDPEYIQNVLNWNESEMDECNQLQKEAVDTWLEIDRKLAMQ
uniref:Uncharacterized protein n=1 Tax=Graphocephala atropunctata TaxID=36148 RepID=A0A1B6L3A4_9HEMI